VIVALSPYHITTREAPAMASLLLAERVVTLVPGPFGTGAGGAAASAAWQAAQRSPRYRELVASWSWSTALWHNGVVGGDLKGDAPTRDMMEISRRIEQDSMMGNLRSLMREELFESEQVFLELVGADLLKGGPDPAITVPIAAAIDRFAARHGAFVARAEPASVVQKAEAKLGTRVFALALPVMLQASDEHLLAVREMLATELDDLREAMTWMHAREAMEPPKGS
jgi:hypothetical protein